MTTPPETTECVHSWRAIADGDYWWCRLCHKIEPDDTQTRKAP